MKSRWLAALLLAGTATAQRHYEIGAVGGYGFYRAGTISGSGISAEAGIRDRIAAGFVAGEDLYEHLSGEVRYLYQAGNPFLSTGGISADIPGESHALHYNLLVHANPREHRLRPYASGGLGGKYFVTSAPTPGRQIRPGLATLEGHDDWRLLVVAGGGLKYRVHRHVVVRGEFLDYMTPFPKRQIVPSGNSRAHGILHQFTPLFGVSYLF